MAAIPLSVSLALISLSNAIRAVCPIDGVSLLDPVAHTVRIDFKASATAPQQTAANAIVAAFDWSPSAQTTRDAQLAKAQATAGVDNGALQAGDKTERIVRAVVLLILDEFNAHALKHNAILDAVDAATSLADLKTRVGLITDYPQRTAQQIVDAIKTKIAGTAE